MLVLEETVYEKLEKAAKKRGIGIQELIRAVIVPEWTELHIQPKRVKTVRPPGLSSEWSAHNR